MVLQPLGRGGKSKKREILLIYEKFLDYKWEELLQFNTPDNKVLHQNQGSSRKNAATRLIRCGEISRAAKILTSPGLAPTSLDTRDKLTAKHPCRSGDLDDNISSNETLFQLSKKDLFSSIRGSPRGSGCGPSGWRYEHIRLLLGACSVSDHLYKACAVIARGHLPHSISSLLSASRLIAVPKKNGDVRPIGVGEVFRRITAKVICNQLKSNFADHLSPLQHGVAVEGGSEMLVHHIQLALESNPSWALLKTDMSNAFNSVNRSNLLQQVESSFPEILNHVK